ncbi:hypothetical protein BGZ95_004767 [Linnemannia exigua]|uniref:Tail specific protease domain-containing protein n=1 Tax=Linnemannia exigua TaxID=604196 RepID=A0AAD4D2Z8_9FUNG|nr:hypothetical protein BGZ95_004767 [Linnemannia exigua]
MVILSIKTLSLSASLVSIAIVTTAAHPILTPSEPDLSQASLLTALLPPPANRACGILGKSGDLTYEKVAACYNSVPFNSQVARTTLESVTTIMNDFYVFRDSALTPDLPKPFSVEPVDILKKLKEIEQTPYTSDHQFHYDLSMALVGLKDAHATYKGYEGCRVKLIDGEDALTHITKWADANSDFSKDPGARLNNVLGTLKYSSGTKTFELNAGEFSLRSMLPKKGHIDFGLVCPSSFVYIRERWEVFFTGPYIEFSSLQTFVQNVCQTSPPSALSESSPLQKSAPFQHREHLHLPKVMENPYKKTKPVVNDPTPPPPPVEQTIQSAATLVGTPGEASVVFQLEKRPDVGILHVHTHKTEGDFTKELDNIAANLVALSERGVRNIIIDLQGNYGGFVAFSSALVQLFFPNKDKADKTLPSNLCVTDSIKSLTKNLFGKAPGELYDASSYYDFATKRPHINNDLFMNANKSIRHGRSANYSDMTTLLPFIHNILGNSALTAVPWFNSTANIRLLTDGRCGSACSMSAVFFQKFNKVITYAVGGIAGEPMSTSSFPGGAVSSLSEVYGLYTKAQVPSPFRPLPYKGDVRFTALEVFAPGSAIPLDFDAPYLTADHRLNFTPENAKDRMVMWDQVAAAAWPA